MISPRLQQGLRRNRGRLERPRFVAELSQALGRPEATMRLLELEQTDALRSAMWAARRAVEAGRRPGFRRRWPEAEVGEVRALLTLVSQQLPIEPVYVIRGLSEYCGAVESDGGEVLRRWEHLVSANGEELLAAPLGAASGMWLELWAEGPGSEENYTFRLGVWGEEWLRYFPEDGQTTA